MPFLNEATLQHLRFLVATEGLEVLGVVGLVLDSHRVPGAIGLAFLSVRQEHRNRGVATCLVSALFELAQARRQDIANTHYKPDGERWLKAVLHRAATKHPQVRLHEMPRPKAALA